MNREDGRWVMAHLPGKGRAGRSKRGIGFSGRVC